MLELQDVTRIYSGTKADVHALEGVSLSIGKGEFVAVRGPSGCGKTTLLLTSGGLLAPSSGAVVLHDQDVYAMSPNQRAQFRATHIGFVFQQFHLIPYLSVRDNIRAASLATRDATATSYADELIDRFGLTERAAHRPGQLSTGERQRTALARALLNRPHLILADEPTGNLDEDNARIVLDRLVAFVDEGGAVLLVTHEDAAASRAQRTIQLERGRLMCAVGSTTPN
jgi:ABC-type lipoprotein export system ATPase subunit